MTRHVLVVEDDRDIRETLGDLLETAGWKVTLAGDGACALDRLAGMPVPPDLILLDLMMPVMDGFHFRSEQRADRRIAEVPVVVMSAAPLLESHAALLGVEHVIRKPFDIDVLLRMAAAEVSVS